MYPVSVPRSSVCDNGAAINMLLHIKIYMWLEQYYFTFIEFKVLTMVIMKSSAFWDIPPYSLPETKKPFGGTYQCLLHVGFFMEATCPPKRQITFNELHSNIFQKKEIFCTENLIIKFIKFDNNF
jgi:hypothetical protein